MKDDGVCTKLAFAIQNRLKRSGLEPKLLQGVYRNSCTAYQLVTNLMTYNELWPTFSEGKFCFTSVGAQRNLAVFVANRHVFVANRHIIPKFDELRPTFPGGKIFDSGYLEHYLSERDDIWQRWGSGQSKRIR